MDAEHSNVAAVWGAMREGDQAWPTDEQWERLREADTLEQVEKARDVQVEHNGTVTITFDLPMPSMSCVTLSPA